MKSFEMSSKENKNGRREFKAILCEIHPDSCVNTVDKCGEQHNKNGITWIRQYCEQALPTISGMSLRCEFLDDERTEINGHGLTGIADGEPIFADATVIGHFTNGYIEDVETDEGVKTYCIGAGEIDASCYHNFCEKLEAQLALGIFPSGSVEFIHADDEDDIQYLYGYKEKGRIPSKFRFSGYAILGVEPADDAARIIELNENKEESQDMTEDQMKALVEMIKAELIKAQEEINKCKEECKCKVDECNEKVAEANAQVDAVIVEKEELIASSEKIKTALEECQAELKAKYEEIDSLYEERSELQEALAKAKARERIGELNEAISEFSEEERKYAEAEINAFNEAPIESEINSVVSKIWEEIGKHAKADAEERKIAEQNSIQNEVIDIFGDVEAIADGAEEDVEIF